MRRLGRDSTRRRPHLCLSRTVSTVKENRKVVAARAGMAEKGSKEKTKTKISISQRRLTLTILVEKVKARGRQSQRLRTIIEMEGRLQNLLTGHLVTTVSP